MPTILITRIYIKLAFFIFFRFHSMLIFRSSSRDAITISAPIEANQISLGNFHIIKKHFAKCGAAADQFDGTDFDARVIHIKEQKTDHIDYPPSRSFARVSAWLTISRQGRLWLVSPASGSILSPMVRTSILPSYLKILLEKTLEKQY